MSVPPVYILTIQIKLGSKMKVSDDEKDEPGTLLNLYTVEDPVKDWIYSVPAVNDSNSFFVGIRQSPDADPSISDAGFPLAI